MLRRVAVLMILLIIAVTFQTPVSAQFIHERKVVIQAVAVKTGTKPEGAVINITVVVTPGNGEVFVSTSPYTEIDMQGSAQLAALTACDLLGIDYMKYDFFYTIHANAPIVGGPSAGGVMCVATIAALKNLSIKRDVFMTGMIYPDGFIGPVGGIPYKLEAAASHGAKYFLIPAGQRIVYVRETKIVKNGPFIFESTVTKPVDVVKLGEKLGVKVVEVETVNQALEYYTGYKLEQKNATVNLTRYSNILKKLADKMKKEAENLYDIISQITTKDELSNIKKIMEEAQTEYNQGRYYTATSEWFTAMIKMRYIQYERTIKTEQALENEFKRVQKDINNMLGYLNSTSNSVGLESFQLYGAAEERITIAQNYLNKAESSSDVNTALYYLAYARERVESARLWLSLLPGIKEDVPLGKQEIKRRAQLYLSQAESMIVYASSIYGQKDLLELAQQDVDAGRTQLDEGLYCGAALSAINAITKASLSIELIGFPSSQIQELLQEKINASKKDAQIAIAQLEKHVTPILPVAYYEFAETSKDPITKLAYFKLSERIAKLIGVLAKIHQHSKLVKVNHPSAPTFEESYTNTINTRVPGFEVVVSIVAVFIALWKRRM
ncbi:MAG: serine protease-like protein [Archaeoglobus sp.]|nr:MAG: serine protease-like protein [Archaeoglobus sp.]